MNNASDVNEYFRALPAVGKIMEEPEFAADIVTYGRELFKSQLIRYLEELRNAVRQGGNVAFARGELLARVRQAVGYLCEPARRRVINATGIMLHTGLGRAPLAAEAVTAVTAATGYTPVQSDPVSGKRSLRELRVESLLRNLTGAEAVTVVNNNAAATMLILNTLAAGRKVVVSRGQLVEIGGAFRMPDVMRMSGAIMAEIGTTNRTHLRDYREAYSEEVAVLLHVHTSNYRIRGFGGTPGIKEIVRMARELGVLAVDDLGSGALLSLDRWGIANEPLVKDSIAAGVDLCCFSGDKLIGGPQSGIICGKAERIEEIRKNPFARMFRVDKLTLAGLEATLALWVNGNYEQIPLYRMLETPKADLRTLAEKIAGAVRVEIPGEVQVRESEAYIGSGSLPDSGVPSWAVVLELPGVDPERGAEKLRKNGVFARISSGRIWLDMIALAAEDSEVLPTRIIAALGKGMTEGECDG